MSGKKLKKAKDNISNSNTLQTLKSMDSPAPRDDRLNQDSVMT